MAISTIPPNIETNYNDYTRLELLLLSMFDENRANGYLPYRYSWIELLGDEFDTKVNKFLQDKAIEFKGLKAKISYKYRVTDLKELLKVRGLKAYGVKDELVNRLEEADRIYFEKQTEDLVLLGCTTWGLILTKQYREFCKQEYLETENLVINSLIAKDFVSAVNYVYEYTNKQVPLPDFSPNINRSFNFTQKEQLIHEIDGLYSVSPPIYKNLRNSDKDTLRLSASLLILGINPPQWIFPQNFSLKIPIKDYIWASRAFIYFLDYQNDLREIKAKRDEYLNFLEEFKGDPELINVSGEMNSYEYIKINTANDDSVCPECRKISKRKYNIIEILELPYIKCTSELGCRCSLLPYYDFDNESE